MLHPNSGFHSLSNVFATKALSLIQSQVSFCFPMGCVMLKLRQSDPNNTYPVLWSQWFSAEFMLEVLQTASTVE